MSAAQTVVGGAAGATPGDALRDLEAYIPGDRRRSLATGTPMPDRVRGAALFADISGFTPLMEARRPGRSTSRRPCVAWPTTNSNGRNSLPQL